jgi:hypothetical protein
MTTTSITAEQAARWTREHPRELCRDFTPKPEPSEFWCATCGWNEPMHADETTRAAIAAELDRLRAEPAPAGR